MLLPIRRKLQSSIALAALIAFVGTSTVATAEAVEPSVALPAVHAAAPAVNLDTFDSESLTPSAQTQYSNTYAMGGGTNVTEVSAEPVNIQDSSGEWVDVETEVAKDGSGGGIVEDNPLAPEFGADAGDDSVLALSDGKYSLSFSLDDAASSPFSRSIKPTPSSPKSDVVYADVFDGVDLTYDVKPGSVKETLVLDSAPAAGESVWNWNIDAEGLSLAKDEFGDLRFSDNEGTVRFTIPAPVMWDSSDIDGVQGASERMVDTALTEEGNGRWVLSLSASPEWLASPDRTYPVYVDPTTMYGDLNYHSYRDDGVTSEVAFRVGNLRNGGQDYFWRTMVKFKYDNLFGKQIIDGKVTATTASGVTAALKGSVNTADCRGYACVGTRIGYLTVDTYGETASKALPAKFAEWVEDEVAGHAVLIRGAETAGAMTYKTLTPTLQLVWQEYPSLSMSQFLYSPEVNGDDTHVFTSLTPGLIGVPVSRSGSSTISFSVKRLDGSIAATCVTPVTSNGAPAGCAPSAPLLDGALYSVSGVVTDVSSGEQRSYAQIMQLSPLKDVSAFLVASQVDNAIDPVVAQANLTASEQELYAYSLTVPNLGEVWEGKSVSDAPADSTDSNPADDPVGQLFAQAALETPDGTAQAARRIDCSAYAETPHGSNHQPGKVNMVATSSCSGQMSSIWHDLYLYKQGKQMIHRTWYDIGESYLWSQVDAPGCKVGVNWSGKALFDYYAPPGYTPARAQVSLIKYATRIAKCGKK